MSLKQSLLIELEHEKNNTLRVLNNLSEENFTYKPHAKSMLLGELVNHVVELHNWIEFAITKDVFNFHTDYTPSKLNTIDQLKLALETGFTKNKAIIEQMDESSYLNPWTLKAGDHVITSLPKAGAIRFIITNHLIHHRGQLTVYMRLLDIPVPGIYGPSADEK